MDRQRQEVFQKLRPPCVELSSVGLKFKAKQVAIKDVLRAIEDQHRVINKLSLENALDAKLAEYAFFPLTHVFNESQRLSSRCLEVAVQSVDLLVAHGWQTQLAPEMGKQLLILMSLLAGGDPRKQIAVPSDELKAAAFDCVATVLKWLASNPAINTLLKDQGTKSIVDQLTYLLAESLSENISDSVQLAASHALAELFSTVSDRVFLASILPRTVSSLVKALRPSTQARRTHKVLSDNLVLFKLVLSKTLADGLVAQAQGAEAEALDESWLKATSTQVRTALLHVTKLQTYDRTDVKTSLADLCVMVIEDCSKSLSESIPNMLETLVVLSGDHDGKSASVALRHLLTSRPELMDMLRSVVYDWTQTLPRVMQANDDGPKESMLRKVANAFDLLAETLEASDNLVNTLATTMLTSVSNLVDQDKAKLVQSGDGNQILQLALQSSTETKSQHFRPVLLNHQSQQLSVKQLDNWIQNIKSQPQNGKISQALVNAVPVTEGSQKLTALWLAIQLLRKDDSKSFDIEDLIITDSFNDRSTSRPYLIYDLYSFTKDLLIESSPYSDRETDWRLTALALEVLTLQAQQMGKDYRNELYETLYPVLALFNSNNDVLQTNAVTALNLLASACQYDSAKQMLIENVDYLVNSIAWKLNTFALSPEAPRVLNMVVRLVGAHLLPYLDDLVASIFIALDSYHGYPTWVEMLFTVLKTIVDESAKQPTLALTETEHHQIARRQVGYQPISMKTVLNSLQARKKQKLVHHREDAGEDDRPAPRRPWTSEKDDPNYKSPPSGQNDLSLEELLKQDEDGDLPAPSANHTAEEEDPMKPKSKSHDLLLQIAQATVPHLSSPSPRVRHLLLQLLQQISPLLARHENTFLPLVNSIWPAIIPRLFADQITTQSIDPAYQDAYDDSKEFPYNIVAAAELVSILCENAGDFMSGRVEQIFRQLIQLFTQTLNYVEASQRRSSKNLVANGKSGIGSSGNYSNSSNGKNIIHTRPHQNQPNTLADISLGSPSDGSGPNTLRSTVDLHIIKQQQPPPSSAVQQTLSQTHPQGQTQASTSANAKAKAITQDQNHHDHHKIMPPTLPSTTDRTPLDRTSQSQILSALVTLLTSILTNVRLPSDKTNEITSALQPFVTMGGLLHQQQQPINRVVKALDLFNSDLLWLMMERDRVEMEIVAGSRPIWDREWDGNSSMPTVPVRAQTKGAGVGLVQVTF